MGNWLLEHEPAVRMGAFVAIFGAMALWELGAARRPLRATKGRRWLANLGLVAVNTGLLRLLFPAAAVGMALAAREGGWGLFNNVELPTWLEVLAAIALLDFAIYLQHVVFHAVPTLWRLHMVHHADVDFDVTTGLRFHPVEILLSMIYKLAVVAALGAAPVAVLVFEVVLNATAMFNHGNVRLARPVDRRLRWLVVTPEMHRVHHSVKRHETNSNFGFNLPWWDRLFGTYRDQPEAGHEGMTIGLVPFQEPPRQTLTQLLTIPFRRPSPGVESYAITGDREPGGDDGRDGGDAR